VTVKEWLAGRQPPTPPALAHELLQLLGGDADAPVAGAAEVCLDAAARALDDLLKERRYERDSALRLLAIDALTTCAFEHASGTARTAAELDALARHGTRLFGEVAAHG
jgi:hypothetical protein